MSEVLLTGGCQCGAARSAISAAPLQLFACHCRTGRILPLPLREGGGGRGRSEARTDRPLPPTPSLKGRGKIPRCSSVRMSLPAHA
jgi:hypothetical protein